MAEKKTTETKKTNTRTTKKKKKVTLDKMIESVLSGLRSGELKFKSIKCKNCGQVCSCYVKEGIKLTCPNCKSEL